MGDILPLYVEKIVCEDTSAMVEEHLSECEQCRALLKNLHSRQTLPVADTLDSFKLVKKQIFRKRLWTAAAAVCLLLSLAAGIIMYLCVPFWLDAEEAIAYIQTLDDGSIKIKTTDLVYGQYQLAQGSNSVCHIGLLMTGSRWRQMFPRQVPQEMNEASREGYFIIGRVSKSGQTELYANQANGYYLNYTDGSVSKVLWNGTKASAPGAWFFQGGFQPSWVLKWLCFGTAVISAVLGVVLVFARKKKVWLFWSCAAAGISLSTLIITSGRFLTLETGELYTKLGLVGLLSLLISATALCFMKLNTGKIR